MTDPINWREVVTGVLFWAIVPIGLWVAIIGLLWWLA